MNKEQKELVKKISIISGISILLIILIVGVYYLAFWLKANSYYNSAEYVIKNSPYCEEYKNIKINKDILFSKELPNFINAVFKASDKRSAYYVVFVNVSGKYGTYQAVFLYSQKSYLKQSKLRRSEKKNHTIFCGIVGNDNISKSPRYYGISDFLLQGQIKKIEAIFDK